MCCWSSGTTEHRATVRWGCRSIRATCAMAASMLKLWTSLVASILSTCYGYRICGCLISRHRIQSMRRCVRHRRAYLGRQQQNGREGAWCCPSWCFNCTALMSQYIVTVWNTLILIHTGFHGWYRDISPLSVYNVKALIVRMPQSCSACSAVRNHRCQVLITLVRIVPSRCRCDSEHWNERMGLNM